MADDNNAATLRSFARFGLFALLCCGAVPAEAIEFSLPVACEVGRTCFIQNYVDHDPSAGARDYRCGRLTYDKHNGTDFRLPDLAAQRAGVDVLAAAEGRVLRSRDGVSDAFVTTPGSSGVEGRECGNGVVLAHGDGWESQYCHLARGSIRIRPGQSVAAGQPIGRVGYSGLTQFPHLHFTVRHAGQIVDPFAHRTAGESCSEGPSLWPAALRDSLAYRGRAVLNAGFAQGPMTMERIEAADARTAKWRDAPALVAYVRAIGLKAGDVQSISIKTPDGGVLAQQTAAPLDRDKAQVMLFVGKKRPPGGWPTGRYQASYSVRQEGRVVLDENFTLSF
jgi:murein DD-endopeptidase MepM/ murein hydrolase activator NlpD